MEHALGNIVVAVAVLALVVFRQLQPRAVKEEQAYRLMLILGVVGVYETYQFAADHTVHAMAWTLFGVTLLIGAGFGVVRGRLTHVWRNDDGVLMRQGNLTTTVLWVVAMGLHIGLDLLLAQVDPATKDIGSVSALLFLAVSLGVQRVVTLQRAEHLGPVPAAR